MRVGFVGWRGMVGSVLLSRMSEEGDWEGLEPVFFSTSNPGGAPPDVGLEAPPLADAFDLDVLEGLPVVVSCQGGAYTERVHGALRGRGWSGIWIDAASTLRMRDDAIIVLDPINRSAIDEGLRRGVKDFVGGNCTVSLMLLAMGGLFRQGWVSWMTSMTYQAASGAGAANLTELVRQMRWLGDRSADLLDAPRTSALDLERRVRQAMREEGMPTEHFGHALAGSLLPWIDTKMPGGESREEWKGDVESQKILGQDPAVPVDGICVRIGALRCHAQALTVGLRQDVPLDEIEAVIEATSPWTRLVPNDKETTLQQLTPTAVTGTLDIPVGRVRKLKTAATHLGAFTVGDQLLWGAAEPVRRMLAIYREHAS